MDNSEPGLESSFSSTKEGNHNGLLELEGSNSDEAKTNYAALINAIEASDVGNVKLLLENSCIVSESGGYTFEIPIQRAIEVGNLEIIELLLDADSLLTQSSTKTQLYRVMKNQQFDVVDLMLSKYNTENIDPNDKQEFVHFVIACIRNNGDLVEQFINKGIDVNGVLDDYAHEWAGYTPLYLSVKYLSVKVVEILLKHQANFTYQDKSGNSPLHLAYYAWKSKNTESDGTEKASDLIMDLILAAHTKNINNFVNNEGLSHFHIACMGHNATLVYYFLQSGVDVNSPVSLDPQNSPAKVPLHLAVEHCRKDIVKILLEHEADINAKDSNGLTSLQIALENKLYKIAELILEFKDAINTEYLNNAIFHLISESLLPKTGKILDMMFLACQENLVNSVNEDGISLLHVACNRNNIDVIKKLLQSTSDVNACVHKTSSIWAGYTALHFAASAQNLEAIHVLLDHQGSDCMINVRNATGQTPLFIATLKRNVDCMKLLLDHGADINIKDCENTSPMRAIQLGFGNYRFDMEEVKSLVWHSLKLLMIDQPVDPSYLLRCKPVGEKRFEFYCCVMFICVEEDNDTNVPRKYTAKLRDEVEKLKNAKIDDYNSLFDILGKNLQRMTIHVRNEAFKEQVCSENLETRFPEYGYLLKLKFRDGLARNDILEEANESLQYVTRTNLPYICVDNIFSYVDNKDLKNLVLAAQ